LVGGVVFGSWDREGGSEENKMTERILGQSRSDAVSRHDSRGSIQREGGIGGKDSIVQRVTPKSERSGQ